MGNQQKEKKMKQLLITMQLGWRSRPAHCTIKKKFRHDIAAENGLNRKRTAADLRRFPVAGDGEVGARAVDAGALGRVSDGLRVEPWALGLPSAIVDNVSQRTLV
jgi:hypothetical protein